MSGSASLIVSMRRSPCMSRRPRSTTTTSGFARPSEAVAAAALSASPHTSMPASCASRARSPSRTSGWSSTMKTRMRRVPGATGARLPAKAEDLRGESLAATIRRRERAPRAARNDRPTPLAPPDLQLPAEHRAAILHDADSQPGVAVPRVDEPDAVVGDLHSERPRIPLQQPDHDPAGVCMPHRVHDRLARNAVELMSGLRSEVVERIRLQGDAQSVRLAGGHAQLLERGLQVPRADLHRDQAFADRPHLDAQLLEPARQFP